MSLLSGSGLQAGSAGLWPQTPSKICLCPAIPRSFYEGIPFIPGRCQKVFPLSVPGGGVWWKARTGRS